VQRGMRRSATSIRNVGRVANTQTDEALNGPTRLTFVTLIR
jgi:hypothetical protein